MFFLHYLPYHSFICISQILTEKGAMYHQYDWNFHFSQDDWLYAASGLQHQG